MPEKYRRTEIIEVPMWQWKSSTTAVLETVGLGPCIGVATYSESTRKGHLGHFPSSSSSTNKEFEQFLASVINGTADIQDVKVWLTGGGLVSIDPHQSGYLERKIIIDKLLVAGLTESNITMQWVDEDQSAELKLDCRTGIVDILLTESSDQLAYALDDFLSEEEYELISNLPKTNAIQELIIIVLEKGVDDPRALIKSRGIEI